MASLFTLCFKRVKRNIGSILIICLTVFLATVLSAGMICHTINFPYNTENYFDKNKMWDIKITSNLGFTREDVIAVSDAEGVENATALIAADTNVAVNSVGNYGAKIYGIGFDSVAANPDSEVSAPRLIKGSYPTDANSCVAVVSNALSSNIKIGDTVSLNNNTGYAAQTDFTVTGLVSSPEYVSFVKTTNTVNDNGTDVVIFVRNTAFSPEAPYTEINVILEGTAALNSFSREYIVFVNTASGPINVVAREREQKRGAGIHDEYTANIEKLQKQYDYIKNEGEKEVKELTEIIKSITKRTDAEEKRLQNVKAQLDNKKAELGALKNDASYQEKKQEYDASLAIYQRDKENNDLNKGTVVQLEKDKKSIEQSTAKKLEEAKKNLDNAKNNSPEDYAQKWSLSYRTDNVGYANVHKNYSGIAALFSCVPFIVLAMCGGVVVIVTYFAVRKNKKEIDILKTVAVDAQKTQIRLASVMGASAVIGGVLGVIFAPKIIPSALSSVLSGIYDIPVGNTSAGYIALIISIVFVLLAVISTLVFVRRMLVNPEKAQGKDNVYPTLSEKIPVIFRVLIRNIIKEKYLFSIFALCVAAVNVCVLFVLSINYPANKINTKQYENIQKYDLTLTLKPMADYKQSEQMSAYLGDKEYLAVTRDTVMIKTDETNSFITTIVPETPEQLSSFISVSGDFTKDAVIVTDVFAKKHGIKKDSVLETKIGEFSVKFTVTDITKNYVGDYIYIHPDLYKQTLGTEVTADTLFVKKTEPYNIADEIAVLDATGVVYGVTEEEKGTENTEKLSRAVYYPSVILGAVMIMAVSCLLYSKRGAEIKQLRFSFLRFENIAAYFALEAAAVCLVGTVLGVLLSLLVNLPFAQIGFDGIGTVSYIGFVPLIKTVGISVLITVISCAVNVSYKLTKK